MRHVYSVVRFVPDPAKGESINIGILAGSEDSREWALRTVERKNRARAIDYEKALPGVVAHLELMASRLDVFTDAQERLLSTEDLESISENWLAVLASESRGVLQFR